MTNKTLNAIRKSLEETSIEEIFTELIENAEFKIYGNEENGYESDHESYALMFNVETDELFFLNYANSSNGWGKTAESQNPWILVCYISALDIAGNADEVINEALYAFERCRIL